jgi:imidazolonepropionase-like amidohydrolase
MSTHVWPTLAAAVLCTHIPTPGDHSSPRIAAQDLDVSAAPQVLFQNVRVWDGTSEALTGTTQVLVEGNTIKAIGEVMTADAKATVIDGGGRTLMPGLIDSHTHLNLTGLFNTLSGGQGTAWDEIGAMAAANARDYLMDGYTTIRDIGGMASGLKRVIDRGHLVGPRIYPSGAIIGQTSGHTDWRTDADRLPGVGPTNLERLGVIAITDDPDEIREVTRLNLSNGAAQIKICTGGGVSSTLDPLYSEGLTVESIRACVEAAASWDTYVAAHAYTAKDVTRAIEAGVRCIEHAQNVDEATVELMVEKGVFWALNTAGLSEILYEHPNYAPTTPSGIKVRKFHAGATELVDLIKKHKPKIVHNVDTVLSTFEQGRSHRDFEKYQFASMFGNHALLVSMTSAGGELAELTGRRNPYPGKLGVIEPGAYADILVVDGNPLEDAAVLGANPKWFDAEPRGEGIETIRVIMKDGAVYKNTLD